MKPVIPVMSVRFTASLVLFAYAIALGIVLAAVDLTIFVDGLKSTPRMRSAVLTYSSFFLPPGWLLLIMARCIPASRFEHCLRSLLISAAVVGLFLAGFFLVLVSLHWVDKISM